MPLHALMFEGAANDGADDWVVRESRRARRLSVRVYRTGRVEVVVPHRTSQRTVVHFLRQHRAWIDRKRTKAQRTVVPAGPFPPQSIELRACVEKWRVHVAGGRGNARVGILTPGLLGLSGNTSDLRQVHQALRRWLMTKAHDVLAPLLSETARRCGFEYSRVAIRRQRTRWGSCSKRGTISLNVSLLFQRPEVVRYLLIHELAHTRHMNHSPRFWQCVADCCPDYKRLDRELRESWQCVPTWVFDTR